MSRGWQRLAHRRLDAVRSQPWQPVHTHDRAQPAGPGEIVAVDVALLPHATRFRTGDELRIEVGLRWPIPRGPFRGQFPVAYEASRARACTLHTGSGANATLLVGLRMQPD